MNMALKNYSVKTLNAKETWSEKKIAQFIPPILTREISIKIRNIQIVSIGLASKMSKADQIDMYRSLLLGDLDNKKDKEEKDVHMEVSWNPDNMKNNDDDVS